LYKRIFAFLIFKNKNLLLNQNQIDYYMEKEVAAALESVIPRAALGPFVTLNPSEKVYDFITGHLIGRISKSCYRNSSL